MPKHYGIDVSEYQGNIDWNKVKNSGVEFVIFRAGMGKSTPDKMFTKYIEGAIKVGLHIGIYWFIYATDLEYARKNAEKCLSMIAPYRSYIDMGVWCDYEGDSDRYFTRKGLPQPIDAVKYSIIQVFCDRIIAEGYPCGIYINQYYLQMLGQMPYPLWYAHYCSEKTHDSKKRCDIMWQFSASGAVNGINGRVDRNYYYGNFPFNMANPFPVPERTIKKTIPTMYGLDVAWVQTKLNQHNYGLAVDGKCGSRTVDAIKKYQQSKGLEVDGKCGKLTRESLMKG